MFQYSASYKPAHPHVRLRITDNRRGFTFPQFDALIDTGADGTCIPSEVVGRVSTQNYDYERGRVTDYTGRTRTETFVRILDATVEFIDDNNTVLHTGRYINLRLLVISSGLLGRDILNENLWEFDGPSRQAKIR